MERKTLILVVFIMFLSASIYAQLEREDLYIIGKEFYKNDNYKEAAMYLFAYREINLEYLKANELEALEKINAALDHCKGNIRNEPPIVFEVSAHMIEALRYNSTIDIEGKRYKILQQQSNGGAPMLIEQ